MTSIPLDLSPCTRAADAVAAARARRPARCGRRLRRGRRRAYVLPLTLLLLAVAAASLAGVCRASFEKAVQAANSGDQLQRRWAVTSCRAALLHKAERVLAAADAARGPAAEARVRLVLGGVAVDLVFGDEQAKANVNVLYETGGRAAAEGAVREALASAGGTDVRVALSPAVRQASPLTGAVAAMQQEDEPPLFTTWSEVFGDTPPAALTAPRGRAGESAVAALTCWGDGTLNYRRTSAAALRRVCPKSLGGTGAARLLAIRSKEPDLELWEALEQLELSDEQLEEATDRLTEESTCYSLWIIARSGGRAWYDLSIGDGSSADEGGGAPAATFAW